MQDPAPIPPVADAAQFQKDREHIKLLVIFHAIFAGFALIGLAFLAVHYLVMDAVISNEEMWSQPNEGPPPEVFFSMFKWFYVFGAAALIAFCILNALSALFMHRRQHRMFSLVTAGLNCFQIPLGTTLGVFTILILSRPSVRTAYEEKRCRTRQVEGRT